MGERRGTEGLLDVVDVGAEREPLQNGKSVREGYISMLQDTLFLAIEDGNMEE